MGWTVADAALRAGVTLPDPTQEPILLASMAAAVALAERYCDRGFMLQNDIVEFIEPEGRRLQVYRYPIVDVTKVAHKNGGTIAGSFDFHASSGVVVFDWPPPATILQVEYSGGYAVLPADLEIALWMLFDEVWPTMQPGAAAGSGADVSSVTIPDVGTVRFGENSFLAGFRSAGTSGGGAAAGGPFSILDRYRRLSA